jgi:hypothetical protein
MTRTLSIVLPLLAACSLDANVGSLDLSDLADAAPEPDATAAITPLLHDAPSTILFEGDAMIFDAVDGLARLNPDGTIDVLVTGHGGYMAEDADRIYVAAHAGDETRIVAVDKSSFTVTDLATLPGAANAIAVDDQWVYYDYSDSTCCCDQPPTPAGKLIRIAKDGTGSQVMVDGLDAPFGIAADDNFVYLAEDLAGRILSIPKTGGPEFELVTGANRPAGLMVLDDWLYFTARANDMTDGSIGRVLRPRHGDHEAAAPPETLVTGLGAPTWMAVADGELYWTAYFSGLQRAPLDGGPAETMLGCFGDHEPLGAPNWPQGCGAIAIHGDLVYFSAREPHNISALYAIPR